MSRTSPPSSDPRSLIRYACVALAITIVLLWTLYLVRGPLLIIYVSGLFATGMAPLVEWIERRRVRAISIRRVPRAAAILVIYATVIGLIACFSARSRIDGSSVPGGSCPLAAMRRIWSKSCR